MARKLLYNIIYALILVISVSHFSTAQICSTNRYIDSLYSVTKIYNVEYQQAKPYGSLVSIPYYLDIYVPAADTLTYRPLVIFQFGGGYLVGDKLNPPADEYCSYWAERGYICVSINYRLGFNTLIKESAEREVYRAIQDLQSSLRFLVENQNLYGIDTSNIIISGNSAGAISSIHNAFMDQGQAPASIQGFGFGLDSDNLGGLYSSGNNYSGNVEIKTHGLIANWGGILDTNFIGDTPDDNIPTILFHGDQDSIVHYNYGNPFGYPLFPVLYGSVPMSTVLVNSNIPNYFETFEGAGHEPELINNAYLDTILFKSRDFMYENVLKPQIISVQGNLTSSINMFETYIVVADETITVECVSLNNGILINMNANQFNIVWQTIGSDTIEVVVVNDILAKDTVYIPVMIDSGCGTIIDTVQIWDTTFVTINDTNTVMVYDTTFVTFTDTVTINDTNTVILYDTTYITVNDTNIVIINDTNLVMVYDTAFVTVNDTNVVNVFDTTFITITDTNFVSVSDTLIIEIATGLPAPGDWNTIKIYPNPSNSIIIVDNGNYVLLSGFKIEILNNLGQQMFFSDINSQILSIDITLWSTGLYFINFIEPGGQVVENRKLILN